MQIYSNMTFTGPQNEPDDLLSRLDTAQKLGEWTRDLQAENDISRILPRDEVVRCFLNSSSLDAPHTRLWIDVNTKEWKVTNIVPESDPLSPATYCGLLESFRRAVLPLTAGTPIRISEPVSDVGPEHWLSPDAARLLHQFSVLANKSNGASHPRDRARWNAFVAAVHRDECAVTGEELSSILVEHEQWPEDKASELAILFEYELSLLNDFVKSA